MLLIPQHVLFAWMSAVFWPFLRTTGVFLTAPILGSSALPVLFRVLLATMIAICLAAWGGPWPAIPQSVPAIILEGLIQIACGSGIGLFGQIIVSAIAGGGEIAGAALGTNFATVTGLTPTPQPPVTYSIFYWAGMMVYLGLGGLFWTIEALDRSFKTLPGGIPASGAFLDLGHFMGAILVSGTLIALPALAVSLALNAVTGLANALAPQLNIFSVGFPLLFLGGFWIIASSLFFIQPIAGNLLLHGMKVLANWRGAS